MGDRWNNVYASWILRFGLIRINLGQLLGIHLRLLKIWNIVNDFNGR